MLLDQINATDGGSLGQNPNQGVSEFSKGIGQILGKFNSILPKLDRIDNNQRQEGGMLSSFFAKELSLSSSRNNILGNIDRGIQTQTVEVQKGFSSVLNALGSFAKTSERHYSSVEEGIGSIRNDMSSLLLSINKGNRLTEEILSELKGFKTTSRINRRSPSSNAQEVSNSDDLDSSFVNVLSSLSRINTSIGDVKEELVRNNSGLDSLREDLHDDFRELLLKVDTLIGRVSSSSGAGFASPALPSSSGGSSGGNNGGGSDGGGSGSGSTGGQALGIGMMLSSALNLFGKGMANLDENFASMPNKIAIVMGQNAKGESFNTYRDTIRYGTDRNQGEGHLSELTGGLIKSQLISMEEYNEAMNKVLDTGVANTQKMVAATGELALMNKLMPDISIPEDGYFKNVLQSYEDGADRIRGVSMVIKDYSENMWTTPAKLQETVNKYHSAIASMSKDLTAYVKNMEKYIKTKARMDEAGLDLGVEDTVNKWATTSPTDWTSDMMLQMTSLGLDPGQMEKLSYQDPTQAMDYMIQGIDKTFGKFYNSDGSLNTDVDNMRAFNQQAKLAGFSGYDEVMQLREANMKNGGIDKYNSTANADYASNITGASSQEAMVSAIDQTATDKLSEQTNLSLTDEVKNGASISASTGEITSNIYGWLQKNGVTSKEIMFLAGLLTFKGSGGDLLGSLGRLFGGSGGANAGGTIGRFFSASGGFGTSVRTLFTQIGTKLSSILGSAGGALSKVVSAAGGKLSSVLGAVGPTLSSAWEGISSVGVGSSAAGGTAGAVASVLAPVAGAVWTLVDGVKGFNNAAELTGKSESELQLGDKMSAAVGTALGGQGPGWGDEGTFLEKAGNTLSGAAKGALIGSIGGPIGMAIGGAIGAVTSAIGGKTITKFMDGGNDYLKDQTNDYSKLDASERTTNVLKTIPVVGQLTGLVEGIKSWDSSKGLASNLGTVAAGIGETIPLLGGAIKSVAQWDKDKSLGDNLKNTADNVVTSIPIVGTLWTGLKSLFTPMEDAADKLKDSSDSLNGAASDMSDSDKAALVLAAKSTTTAGTVVQYSDNYAQQTGLSTNQFAYTDNEALLPDALDTVSKNLANYDGLTDTSQIKKGFTNEDALNAGTLSLNNAFTDSVVGGTYGDLSDKLVLTSANTMGMVGNQVAGGVPITATSVPEVVSLKNTSGLTLDNPTTSTLSLDADNSAGLVQSPQDALVVSLDSLRTSIESLNSSIVGGTATQTPQNITPLIASDLTQPLGVSNITNEDVPLVATPTNTSTASTQDAAQPQQTSPISLFADGLKSLASFNPLSIMMSPMVAMTKAVGSLTGSLFTQSSNQTDTGNSGIMGGILDTLLNKDKDIPNTSVALGGLASSFAPLVSTALGIGTPQVGSLDSQSPVGLDTTSIQDTPVVGGDESNPVVAAIVALQQAVVSRLDNMGSSVPQVANNRDNSQRAVPLRVPNIQNSRSIDSQDIRNYTRG